MLKDNQTNELLQKRGFVILPPLDDSLINKFKELFSSLHPEMPTEGHISTAYSKDIEYKDQSNKLILELCKPVIDQLFTDIEIYGSSFVYKVPSMQSQLRPHQDWSLVDESQYQQFNLWIPLCDIDKKNGMMYLIPGSNFKNFPFVRATNVDYFYENHKDVVFQHSIPIKVKAGSIVLFDNSLIHYSDPNLSDSTRVAIVCTLFTKGAPTLVYYHDKVNHRMNAYLANHGFALDFKDFFNDIQKPPPGLPLVKSETFLMPKISRKSLHDLFNQMRLKAGYEPLKFSNSISSWLIRIKNKLKLI